MEQIRAGGFPELETLQLERNRGGARGFSALGEAFASNSLPLLQALNVADNRASDEGLASLSSSLKARGGKGKVLPLRVLQLGGNEITGAGVGPLADSLISGACPCLEELDLRRNHLGHEGGEALARVLRSNGTPVLADLDLSSSQLSVEGMRAVVEVLQEGRGAMRRVSFEDNGGGSEAAALVDSLMGPRGHNPACPLLVSCTV
jgi:Ran GTPase-activating protein (RanGAP) involved in mRNA processing and transport